MRTHLRAFLKEEEGQVIVEYILMITVALAIVGTLGFAFRRIYQFLHQLMACEITAPCPHCPAEESVKNQIVQGVCR